MAVELTGHDFLSGSNDRTGAALVEKPKLAIHLDGHALDQSERPDHRQGHRFRADAEILSRALGLRPPVTIRRDLDGAERVGFDAGVRHHGLSEPLPTSLSPPFPAPLAVDGQGRGTLG